MGTAGHEVVIAGGGPAGMMLAAELALQGVDVAIVEKRPDQELVGSRAGGFHARTLELFDMRGVAERFLAEGQTAQAATLGTTVLDMREFPTRHPYALGIFQNKIERIMAAWLAELPVTIHHARAVTGFEQDAGGVDVELRDGGRLRAGYLVGCDGGRSLIRKLAGIGFPGWDPSRSSLIAEAEVREETPQGVRHDEIGVHGLHVMEDGHTVRIVTAERELGPDSDPTLADLKAAVQAAFGTDFGVFNPTWISRFTDMTRQAAAYRERRVLLAGDAAHIHYPAGGQGIGLGVQDAVNLGWKLAQVLRGTAADTLLDSYQAERHPVTARTLRHTMALTALQRGDARSHALVELVSRLGKMDEVRVYLAGIVSGLDIHYDLGEGHPLLGRRMPDLDLPAARSAAAPEPGAAPQRVFELLRDGRALLLNLAGPGATAAAQPWAD
ncbi:MAG: FAD-dependent monooxygenase, partial [Acidobacteriota bacterium]|nr:FAD-dependent monooxygenase [Acidobacteriota bacterium]